MAVEQETLCVCEDRMEKLKDSFSRIIKPTTFAPKFPTISHGVPAEREELEEHPLIPKNPHHPFGNSPPIINSS